MTTRDTAAEPRTAGSIDLRAAEALGAAIENTPWPPIEGDTIIETRSGHGAVIAAELWRNGYALIEAEAAAPALTAEALAEALIECENDGLFGPNYVPIDAAKAILAHLEPRRTLGAQSDD